LREEADSYVDQFVDHQDKDGHRLVTRNGMAKERTVTTVAGALTVQAPRVDDRRVDESGEKQTFRSSILPPWCRKSPEVVEVLPLMYLHGLSTGDFAPALGEFFGSQSGLSASAVGRLTTQWQDEHRDFMNRDLSGTDYIYVWADGVHTRVRLEEDRLCALVLMGVRLDGRKELIAVVDGYRESAGSWADLLRGCKRRGMKAPVLCVGDGAPGFWKALRDIWPQTREQRCWFHKTGINRPSGSDQPRSWFRCVVSRCRSRVPATRSCRLASASQPRCSASAWSSRTSSSWAEMTSACSASGTKLSHCSQRFA
jgi:transposase-like protein